MSFKQKALFSELDLAGRSGLPCSTSPAVPPGASSPVVPPGATSPAVPPGATSSPPAPSCPATACPPAPKLVYQQGLVVVRDASCAQSVSEICPQLVWDRRLDGWSAPAYRYTAIKQAFAAQGINLTDRVAAACPALDPAPSEPKLRPYQKEALWAWQRSERCGLISLPTGAGKTHIALAAVARCAVPALVLVPTRVLLEQWQRAFRGIYAGRIGQVGDGVRALCPITVCTFESAFRHLQHFGQRFGLLVVDEAHNFGTGERSEALEMAPAPYRMGLSATPPTDPEAAARLSDLIGPVVFGLAVSDLAGSYLSAYETVVFPVDLTAGERLRYQKHQAHFLGYFRRFKAERPTGGWPEFITWARAVPGGVAAMASWHLARQVLSLPQNKLAVIDALLERHHQRRVLIFTRDNCAAYALSRHLLVPALTCHIRRAERTAVLDAFARGQIRVLVSSRVLNEGLDVPDAEVAIIAGGAQGDREYIQRVGRVLRNRPQKTALIYELVVAETFESRSARRHFRHLAAPQKTTSQSPAKSGSFVDKPPASRRPVRPRFK